MELGIYVLAVVAILILVGIVSNWLESSEWAKNRGLRFDHWNKKWPPINEDEFMERLPPGTDRSVALRVRTIVAEQLGVEYDQVYPEQNFVNDLNCD